MTDSEKYWAEVTALYEKLEDAHKLLFSLDTDVYYFLPVGDSVEIYHGGDGEPPLLHANLPVREARAKWRKLVSEGFYPR